MPRIYRYFNVYKKFFVFVGIHDFQRQIVANQIRQIC